MSKVNDYPAISTALQAPVRDILAFVELYDGSLNKLHTYTRDDYLKSITIEKTQDDTKFFGYTICQKANIKLIDPLRQITNIATDKNFTISFNINGSGVANMTTLPRFYVTETNRDDVTGELSITTYDAIQILSVYTVEDLYAFEPTLLTGGYTPVEFALAAANLIDCNGVLFNTDINTTLQYDEGGNFDGTENLRDAITAIAELTGSICFINGSNQLEFKKLSKANPYYVQTSCILDSKIKDNRRLGNITHFNAVGEIHEIESELAGSTQYFNDNPFMSLRTDIDDILNSIFNHYKDFTIAQFNCTWRGNFLEEIGDYIQIVSKSGDNAHIFLLDDTFEYDGSLSQKTEWTFTPTTLQAEISGSTPAELQEQIKQTSARIDKLENEIEFITAEVDSQNEAITAVTLNTEQISLSVTEIENEVDSQIKGLQSSFSTLVEQTITSENLSVKVREALMEDGAPKIVTETGFTFDENGLNISKSDSEISTQITEDGMTVYNQSEEVLKANSEGVKAIDLHATTYLIIGNNSRFEDYGSTRTACFWIG